MLQQSQLTLKKLIVFEIQVIVEHFDFQFTVFQPQIYACNVRGHCAYAQWKHSQFLAWSTRPEGRFCNTTNKKYIWAKWSKHQSLYCPTTTNSQTHPHLGSTHNDAPWMGRNEAAVPSHPKPPAHPALQLKVLTLLFKLLTFRPLLTFALTPAQVHNAPGLGRIACRKYLERGFTYGVRRASSVHMSRAAAAV